MLVRKLVAARRRWGIPGATAIADVAPELGISPWRVETLFYRYRMCLMRPVLLAEWNRLRERGAAMLRAEANASVAWPTSWTPRPITWRAGNPRPEHPNANLRLASLPRSRWPSDGGTSRSIVGGSHAARA
jgi:hypothetical protein